ncbi:MAG TPA: response regulator [Gemmataceae bacterium]|nr:response regulator [Gemmataceae bacterium]
MMPNAPIILIVEDDYDIRILLARYLEERGYRLALANERSLGADILRATAPILLIVDVKLRGGNGLDLAKLAYAMNIPVLLISGEPVAIEQNEGGPIPFLQKPFRLAVLEQKIKDILGRSR